MRLREADPEVAALLNEALAAMSAELPKPSHQRIAPDSLDVWREAFRIIQSREIWSVYGDFVTRVKPNSDPASPTVSPSPRPSPLMRRRRRA